MAFSGLKSLGTLLGLTALVSPFLAIAPALAQDTPLTERSSYIRECRRVNSTIEVFDNSDLSPASSRVGTFTAGTQVTLTGVLREGRAQVYLPTTNNLIQTLGWVDAVALGPCQDEPVAGLCYRARTELLVRSEPTTASSWTTVYNAGAIVYPTTNPPTESVSPNTSPDFGRVWMEVDPPVGDDGWISRTGTFGQGTNVTSLPSDQCRR